MAAAGVGALVSAVLAGAAQVGQGLLRMVPIRRRSSAQGSSPSGFSHILWLSLALMLVVGFGMMQGMAASNTIIQTLVPDDKRGRVMSYYTMAFVGMAPFGSLLAGGLAHVITRFLGGCDHGSCCILGAAWFWRQMKDSPRRHAPDLSRARHHPARARDELRFRSSRPEPGELCRRHCGGLLGAFGVLDPDPGPEPKFPKPDPELPPELPKPEPELPLEPELLNPSCCPNRSTHLIRSSR